MSPATGFNVLVRQHSHLRASCTRRLTATAVTTQARVVSTTSSVLCSARSKRCRWSSGPPTSTTAEPTSHSCVYGHRQLHHHPRQQQWQMKNHYQQCRRRTFARTSDMSSTENDSNNPEDKAKNFVIQIGHSPQIAQGVIDALKQSGMSGTSLLSMIRSMAGRWEVGEDAGLEALVESVKLQLAREQGKKPITLYLVPGNAWYGSSEEEQEDYANIVLPEDPVSMEEYDQVIMSKAFQVEAMTGLMLTDVAKFGDGKGASLLGEYIECACSGIMACSTCHVVIDPRWYKGSEGGNKGKAIVDPPCEDEQDMLDLAYAPRHSSRLGCQITLTEQMDGMIIYLPKGANNLMDDIPFEG